MINCEAFLKTTVAAACLFAMGLLLAAPADDIGGRWVTTQKTEGGTTVITLDLKVEAGKVTGTMSRTRNGAQSVAYEIKDGKLDGSSLSFVVEVKSADGSRITRAEFSGDVAADEINVQPSVNGSPRGVPLEFHREK